jgi:hypothetical protein
MKTPFPIDQFFTIFENYNSNVFPAQILIILGGLLCLILLHLQKSFRNKLIGGFLAFLWIWTGGIYHIALFTGINKAAYAFGAIFILQGIFFLIETFFRNKLIFHFEGRIRDFLGYFFVLFGLIIYPVISYLLGMSFVRTIALGLPCPSTILTLGFLMLTDRGFSKYLLIIPSLWAVIGLSAAINLGVYQDFMMIVAAILANIFLLGKKKDLDIKTGDMTR